MKQQVEVIESQTSEHRRKPNNKYDRRAAVLNWAKAGHCDNEDSEVIHTKTNKNKKNTADMSVYMESPTDSWITERESETMAKGEETGKSHLIVWNKNEPPSVLCSSTQWKPHFPIEMLTDCAVNHANESRTAPGLIFTVPWTHIDPWVPRESRTSSAVIAVSGSSCVLWGTSSLRSYFVWLRWSWEIRSWMSLKTTLVTLCVLQRKLSAFMVYWRRMCWI